MRKYLYSENGFTEKAEWQPNCWVNVECPDNDDFKFLTEELKVPESFLEDIADVDERPRTETEDNWLLTILRIPMQSNQRGVPFITVPIGIITNDGIIVSVCYHHTELIPTQSISLTKLGLNAEFSPLRLPIIPAIELLE